MIIPTSIILSINRKCGDYKKPQIIYATHDAEGSVKAILSLNGRRYQVPEGAEVQIVGVLPVGVSVTVLCSVDGTDVTIPIDARLTTVAGRVWCTVCIVDADGKRASTESFYISVS